MNILIGITGSSAAKLTPKLVNLLEEKGHQTRIIATESAKHFTDYFYTQEDEFRLFKENNQVIHIEYAKWADIFLIAPCTANTLRKIYYGLSDNLVLSTLKAFNKKVFIAPSMNLNMFKKEISLIQDMRYEYTFLWPTTKVMTCGEYGLGAMCDLEDIINIIEGHQWQIKNTFYSPMLFNNDSEHTSHPGWFGAKRKYDIHTGVDLYCNPQELVYPFEEGEIVDIGYFTGPKVNSTWWKESKYISIKGKSGIILYGELAPNKNIQLGQKVKTTDNIAKVVRILNHPPTNSVPDHKMDMLHIELLKNKNTYNNWENELSKPNGLKDPSVYIYNAKLLD